MGVRLSKIKRSVKGKRKVPHDDRPTPSGTSFGSHYDYTYTQQPQQQLQLQLPQPNTDYDVHHHIKNDPESRVENDADGDADSECYEDMDGDSCYISTTDAHEDMQEEEAKTKDDDVYDNLPQQNYTSMKLSNDASSNTKTSVKYAPFKFGSAPCYAHNMIPELAYIPRSRDPIKPAKTPSFDSAYCDSQSFVGRFSSVKHYTDLKKRQSDTNDKTDIIPENFVPSMVEAFRPLIEECIRVNEVLPYLQFIDDREVIIAKERESPKQAASLLLDTIICSDEMGKWATFLNALRTVGYRYIANILLGETELDLSAHRHLLRIFIPEIINNLEPSELIDHLYAKEVISQTDKEEIECEKRNRGSSAASLMLLDRIPRRIQNWYNEFVCALRACGFDFVADNIDLPELNQTSFSTVSECSSSVSNKVTSESASMVTDNMYITPENSASGQFLRRETSQQPIPKIPSMTRSHMPSNSHKPASATSEQKTSVRFSSQLELIEEKRRLTLELQEMKDKQKLRKDIERLQKLINIVADAEADEDSTNEDDTSIVTETHIKQVKSNGTNTVDIEKVDKTTQVEKSETLAMSAGDKIATDVYLSEVRLKDFWSILNAHISREISTALEIELNSKLTDKYVLNNQSIGVQDQNTNVANNVPTAHMQLLRQRTYDSGMYSVSSMYSGAPDNYV